MNTFQTIVYSIIEGMSEFLPIGSHAHHLLVPYVVGWPAPTGALLGALTLGSALALFIYFRHDWASMISCLLQVIIYRRRPMTLDERLPLFVIVAVLPFLISSYYFQERLAETEWSPLIVAGILAIGALLLWMMDSIGRKTKGMFDWKWSDAAVVGVIQASAIVPGWDSLSAILVGALFLNYKREPAVKFAYFAITPLLFGKAYGLLKEVNFHSSSPMPDFSWLSFAVAIVVSCFVGILAIGGFIKHIQQKGLGQYVAYRLILALGTAALFWVRSH